MVVVKRALVVLAGLGLAACTALLGIDKDYTQGTSEGGLDATACPTCDGPIADSSSDTGTGMDGMSTTSPCAQQHSFCEDFDKSPLGIGWTGTYVGSYAKMGIDNNAFVSMPNALSSETPLYKDAPNDPASEAHLVRMILGNYKQVSVDADIRIDVASQDPNLTVELLALAFVAQNGNPNWHVVLHHYPNKLSVVEQHFGYPDGGFAYVFNDIPQEFVIGQWTHVHVDVVPNGPKTHAKVLIGGKNVFDADLQEVWPSGMKFEVQVGAWAMYWGADHWKVRHDNVVVDLQ